MSAAPELTFDEALDAALAEEMRRDATVFCMGTNPPAALIDEFGPERVRRAPIAESAMTGMAVGAAGSGMRPVVLWSSVNFSFVAFDQVVNQAARIRYMFGGQRDFPIVLRGRFHNGTRSAAQHSQTAYALYAHAGGLKVVVPSGPAEAHALLTAAIRDPDPVVLIEPGRLAEVREPVPSAVPALAGAALRRRGADVTVVALGYMVSQALVVAERLAGDGIDVEVLDPRAIVPLDVAAIRASVRRTGRLVVVDESLPTCSVAAEVIAAVVEDDASLAALRAAPRRVCTAPVPVPFSPVLEDFVLPGQEDIRAAIAAVLDADATSPTLRLTG